MQGQSTNCDQVVDLRICSEPWLRSYLAGTRLKQWLPSLVLTLKEIEDHKQLVLSIKDKLKSLKCWISSCHIMHFCMLNWIHGHGQHYLNFLLIESSISPWGQRGSVRCRVDPSIARFYHNITPIKNLKIPPKHIKVPTIGWTFQAIMIVVWLILKVNACICRWPLPTAHESRVAHGLQYACLIGVAMVVKKQSTVRIGDNFARKYFMLETFV